MEERDEDFFTSGTDNLISAENPLVNDGSTVLISEDRAKVPLWKLITLTISFCGIFFAYSLQGVVIVPLFLSFGLSQSETSLVMLISPIAVIVTFPVIGILSDNCTLRIGRRRPFILIGVTIQVSNRSTSS